MDKPSELLELFADPARRRSWLLAKALDCCPLDRALELARSAETFIGAGVADGRLETAQKIAAVASTRKGPGMTLSEERREQLLERLAQGASNAALADAFGLTPKQVQGLRIGSSRAIAKRRERQEGKAGPAATGQMLAASVSIEEIVRYLRQQDDIVVPQENGVFLVNARFRMPAAELVARANRMRNRQGRPPFLLIAHNGQAIANGPANGHPLFWNGAGPDHVNGDTAVP